MGGDEVRNGHGGRDGSLIKTWTLDERDAARDESATHCRTGSGSGSDLSI